MSKLKTLLGYSLLQVCRIALLVLAFQANLRCYNSIIILLLLKTHNPTERLSPHFNNTVNIQYLLKGIYFDKQKRSGIVYSVFIIEIENTIRFHTLSRSLKSTLEKILFFSAFTILFFFCICVRRAT